MFRPAGRCGALRPVLARGLNLTCAAALAAAQELALATGVEPAAFAADYAARNGAEMTSCACSIGSLEAAITVTVEVVDLLLLPGPVSVNARARAVVDLPSPASAPP